jgi:hypothetical protein
MTRVRTLIAAALLTIPMLTVSATSPAEHSTQVIVKSPLPAPAPQGCCYWIAGRWYCFC